MPINNSSGITTKTRIIKACKVLFYQNGFTSVTFDEICKKSGTHPGSIAYHFKNKITIAQIIYEEIINLFSNKTADFFPDEDLAQQNMIALGIHIKLLFEDSAYRRFSSQVCAERAYNEELFGLIKSVPNAFLVAKQYMSEQKSYFYFNAFLGMESFIESYIHKHIENLNFKEISSYYLELHYPFLEKEDFLNRLNKMYQALDILDIESTENFKISIRYK